MEMLRDDFHRRADGQIDYDYYRARAAELRREERDRVLKAALMAAFAAVRDAAAGLFGRQRRSPAERASARAGVQGGDL